MNPANSRRKTSNAHTPQPSARAEKRAAAIAFGTAGARLHGGLRPRFDAGTNPGCADERAPRRGMRQHLRGEGVGRGKEATATRLGDKGIAGGRHASGVAARQAGAKHERVLFPAVTDRSGGRAVPKPDGELRLQQRSRKVRPGHLGAGGRTGKADHCQSDQGRHGSRPTARRPDRGTDQVHRAEAAARPGMAPRTDASRGGRTTAGPVGGDNRQFPQGGHAGASSGIHKVYCAPIPFCNASEQHQAAVDAGHPPRAIFVEGRGAETFDACIAQFRGQGGALGLIGGLRVLGASRVMIVARVRHLKSLGIRPYDLETGETDETELLNAAIAKINGQRALGEDPRRPRRIGSKGGRAKGAACERRRNAIMHNDVVRRICTAPELNWKRRAEILGGAPFSESTLRRLYGTN